MATRVMVSFRHSYSDSLSKINKQTCVSLVLVAVACKTSRRCLCKKAMAVRETGPWTETDAQRGSTYVLYIIRPPATFEASRRYQVDAIAKHQPRACCGSSNRMKTKAGCVGTGPCNYLCTTLSMRRLCPRTTTAGKVSSVARTTTNSIVDVPRRHSAESFVLHLRPSFLSDCICTDRLLSRPTNGGGLSCQQIVARATIQVKS
jgi:hypothetical protein